MFQRYVGFSPVFTCLPISCPFTFCSRSSWLMSPAYESIQRQASPHCYCCQEGTWHLHYGPRWSWGLSIPHGAKTCCVWSRVREGVSCPIPPLCSPQLWASLYYLGTSVALLELFHLREHLVITVSLTSVNNLSCRRAQMKIQGNQILKNRYQ